MTGVAQERTRLQVLLQQVGSNQPSVSGWPSALRRGLLVGVIVIVGVLVGEFAISATMAVGALNLGLVDAAVPRRQLASALAAVTVVTSVVAIIAASVAGTWWAVPLLMALAYTTGAIGSAGLVAFNTTFMALVTGVLFTNDPGDLRSSALLGLWVFIGSVLQSVSTLIAWRYEREAALRRGLVNMVTELRQLALATETVATNHLRAGNAQMNVEALIDGAHLSTGREKRYRDLLQELTWTRLCLSNWISTGHPTSGQREWVANALVNVDAHLRRRPRTRRHPNPEADQLAAGTASDPAWLTLCAQLESLRTAAHDFHAHIFRVAEEDLPDTGDGHAIAESVPGDEAAVTGTTEKAAAKFVSSHRLRSRLALLGPGAAGFRHASRLAVAVGVAESIALAFHVERGYWIALTVVMVVKPDFSTTLVRGILRVLGTTAAVIVGGLVLSTTDNPQWLMVLLVLVFAPLTMRWMSANYAFASFAIGSTVLLLIEAGDPGGVPIILRLENTLIGAVIGLAAYLLWPRWSGDSVRTVLANAAASQQHWTDFVLGGLANNSYDLGEARRLGSGALDAMLTARPAVEAAIIEPHRAECNPQAALGILDACERAAMATLSMEVRLRDRPTASTDADLAPHATTIAHHIDVDFDVVQSLLTGGAERQQAGGAESLTTASAKLTADTHGGTSPGESHWPDPVTARAINLLLSSADATVSAAREL